jgi:hypothetical protein
MWCPFRFQIASFLSIALARFEVNQAAVSGVTACLLRLERFVAAVMINVFIYEQYFCIIGLRFN